MEATLRRNQAGRLSTHNTTLTHPPSFVTSCQLLLLHSTSLLQLLPTTPSPPRNDQPTPSHLVVELQAGDAPQLKAALAGHCQGCAHLHITYACTPPTHSRKSVVPHQLGSMSRSRASAQLRSAPADTTTPAKCWGLPRE